MIYRNLGATGLKVSIFSLGTWITFNNNLTKSDTNTIIDYAFNQGVNLFDTAEVYGEGRVENLLGDVLQELQLPRDQFLLSTKVFWGGRHILQSGLTRKHIFAGCEQSLKRLQTDYIDLYLCHRPDMQTPIEETVIAMNMLMQQGKILYWGTSEWPAELIIEAFYIARQLSLVPPSVEQFEYNMFCRDNAEKNFPAINKKTGVGSLATMPLANGILAGRYNETIPLDSRANLVTHPYFRQLVTAESTKDKIAKAKKLSLIAQEVNMTLPQLVLNWCLRKNNIHSVILGVSKLSQLQENLQLFPVMSHELTLAIDEILNNCPVAYYEPTYDEVIAES